jgi:hypothetical protein
MRLKKYIFFVLLAGVVLASTAVYLSGSSAQRFSERAVQGGKPTLVVFYSQG